jgi:hypothetical protein
MNDTEPSIPPKGELLPELSERFNPNRLAGHRYTVTLDYHVKYIATVIAGPEDYHAVEEARKVATPAGPVEANDWDLVNKDVVAEDNILMDDPKAPKAADWLDEPHVPSENTYFNDSRHFEEVNKDA